MRCSLPAKLNVKPTSCRVHIDGGKYVGIPRTDGSFVVHDVPAGTREPQLHQSRNPTTWLCQPLTHRTSTILAADFMEVSAIGLQFPQMRVHISKKKSGAVQAKLVEETNGGRGDRISYPFVLEPRGQIAYFDKREQVNIIAMIIVRRSPPR